MNYTSSDVIKSFDRNAWSTLLFPTFSFFYIISWLGFLCYKHYGSAKSAHIFELNVLLDSSLFYGSFVWEILWGVLSVEPGPWMCSLMMTPQHVTTICYYSAIAASHLETLLFLKVYSFHPNKLLLALGFSILQADNETNDTNPQLMTNQHKNTGCHTKKFTMF